MTADSGATYVFGPFRLEVPERRLLPEGRAVPLRTKVFDTQEALSRVTRYALAVLLLTSVHHAYGAYVYHTPWRLDAVVLRAFAAAAIISPLVVIQRRNTDESVRKSRSGRSPR
jgi:hypothetical protein